MILKKLTIAKTTNPHPINSGNGSIPPPIIPRIAMTISNCLLCVVSATY